jgi:hypothetical protein
VRGTLNTSLSIKVEYKGWHLSVPTMFFLDRDRNHRLWHKDDRVYMGAWPEDDSHISWSWTGMFADFRRPE